MVKSLEELLGLTEALVIAKGKNPLSYIQKIILTEALLETKKTYDQIAEENGYSPSYLKNGVAPHLWQLLSDLVGEKVTKANCRCLLDRELGTKIIPNVFPELVLPKPISLESPEGQVPLNSIFYIERSSSEPMCYLEIKNQGALLRIKAPRKMGKTSLMARILDYAQQQNYHPIRLSLHLASSLVFTSTEKFLRWLCANVTQQLGLESEIDEFWDEDVGALVSSSLYFQGYLLEKIQQPIVLAMDEVNQLFEYPSLARDILALLRSWHEETRDISNWQKLRFVIVYSTDIYIPLDTNKSPFNVGLGIDLYPFNLDQVKILSRRYGLTLTEQELKKLTEFVGGFPYLVRLAFDHCVRRNIPLPELLEQANTDMGIYSDHLHEQLWLLQQDPDLVTTYQQIITTTHPVKIEQVKAFKLKSMGLVHIHGNQVIPSCELYRQYFQECLSEV
ncbi:AAA-like domain-containing protein [Planktothrix sp. FACHB-1365]|uniref:AAA-like domain-containing protein n=1 Tax=Planktothrix sp. FACHB-1365 TaxID=2692855 RepID=UPI0016846E90|nr:AAA-like domain-containing protein [Planktothrix sp. FACHB-1365]MBD2482529.1 AAA-like domain-containing protein [Planktothrix sp. FACHB-1365]